MIDGEAGIMRDLSASELLDLCEQGMAMSDVQRSLLLLAKALPSLPPQDLAALTIGERDIHLMRLRDILFGSRLDCIDTCPGCGEILELYFNSEDIVTARDLKSGEDPVAPEELSVSYQSYLVRFKLPSSLDVIAASVCEDVSAARKLIIERCALEVTCDGHQMPPQDLPDEIANAVSESMDEADRAGNIQLQLKCPACGQQWPMIFDIVSFLWREISAWAHHTLRDVHDLARLYGWSESDILAMSPWRRQAYLEMVNR
jgi:hypothetical protein